MSNKTLIVLIGGPCSGKSSTGRLVAKKMNTDYISSGDIARRMAQHDDIVKNDINSGRLAPEWKMRQSISRSLFNSFKVLDRDLVILDGFPRFGEQAEWLHNELPKSIQIKYVLINASSWVLRDRARNRNREDDSSFERRFDYYRKVTCNELFDYLNVVINTNDKTVEECAIELEKYIKEVTGCSA